MKHAIAICVSLALGCTLLAGCSGTSSWSTAESAIDRALDQGDAQKALQICQTYLDRGGAEADAYLCLAELLEQTGQTDQMLPALQSAVGQAELPERSDRLDQAVERFWQAQIASGAAADLQSALPTRDSLTLMGVPFAQVEPEDLRAYFPVSEESTFEQYDPEYSYWNESYNDYSLGVNYSIDSDYRSLSVDISALDQAGQDYYEQDGPPVELPLGLAEPCSYQQALALLGFSEPQQDLLRRCSSVDISQGIYGLSIWCSYPYEDSDWQNLSLRWDTSRGDQGLVLYFSDGMLDSFSMDWSRPLEAGQETLTPEEEALLYEGVE